MKSKKKKAKLFNFARGGEETNTFNHRKAGCHASRSSKRCKTRAAQKDKAIKFELSVSMVRKEYL